MGETEKRTISAGQTERNKSSMPGCKIEVGGSGVGETEKRTISAGETERNKPSMPGCKMGGRGF